MSIKFPDQLNIIIRTSIPGFQEIEYKPSMTIKGSSEKDVKFNPLIQLNQYIINNIPEEYRIKQFFNKGLFQSLLNYTGATPAKDLLQATRYGYVDNNINVTLNSIFPVGSVIYIDNKEYVIADHQWTRGDWKIKGSRSQLTQLPKSVIVGNNYTGPSVIPITTSIPPKVPAKVPAKAAEAAPSVAQSASIAATSAASAVRSAAIAAPSVAQSAATSAAAAVRSAAESAQSTLRSAAKSAQSAAQKAAQSATTAAQSAAQSVQSAAQKAAQSVQSAAQKSAQSATQSATSAVRSAASAVRSAVRSSTEAPTEAPIEEPTQESTESSTEAPTQESTETTQPTSETNNKRKIMCMSKDKDPVKCNSKKDYLRQARIFHPDNNFDCLKDSTVKMQKLNNLCPSDSFHSKPESESRADSEPRADSESRADFEPRADFQPEAESETRPGPKSIMFNRGGSNSNSKIIYKIIENKNNKNTYQPKLTYVVVIDMELYKGTTLTPEQISEAKCNSRYNAIRKAFAEFTGKPYVIPPVYPVSVNNTKKNKEPVKGGKRKTRRNMK
jgi:hypothetical protein